MATESCWFPSFSMRTAAAYSLFRDMAREPGSRKHSSETFGDSSAKGGLFQLLQSMVYADNGSPGYTSSLSNWSPALADSGPSLPPWSEFPSLVNRRMAERSNEQVEKTLEEECMEDREWTVSGSSCEGSSSRRWLWILPHLYSATRRDSSKKYIHTIW